MVLGNRPNLNLGERCDHYFEEFGGNEIHAKIRCIKCHLVDHISQRWQYLSDGKVMTREGQGE